MTSKSSSPASSPPPPEAVDDARTDKGPSTDQETLEQPEASASESSVGNASESFTPIASAGTWQAIFSPQHNTYYFYNSATQETTWTNPLQPDSASEGIASTSTTPLDSSASPQPEPGPSTSSSYAALHAAAVAAGIDPSLAHLDPTLASSIPGAQPSAFSYTAKFNARTGAFAKPDARDPTHLSEYERAKRMSEFYFDVGAWEKDVEERKRQEAEGEGKKRKRPTKKDLDRFKEQKKQKKIAKTAWLRT